MNESKKEKRLRKRIERQKRNNIKNARLSDKVEIKNKYIRSSVKPDLTKSPRITTEHNYKNNYFEWDAGHSDTDGNWSWQEPRQWGSWEYLNTIKHHMDSHTNNAWSEVEAFTYSGKQKYRKHLNKYQGVESICPEAQERWMSLENLAQFEELFRMRLGGGKRIWGVRVQHLFFLVWYERYHKICPVNDD